MKIKSPSFEHQGNIPEEFSCRGQGVSPALNISDVPSGTRSLALIVSDPDAPSATFYHWVLWNLDPGTRELKQGAVPVGAMAGKTSAGSVAFVPPCPPSGTHRYHFDLYALNDFLELEIAETTARELERAMEGKIIEQARLTGMFTAA